MKKFASLFTTLFISISLFAQTIHYSFSAPNAVHHEAEIGLTVNKLSAGPAYFRMSRSSPGRYATHEFGKNVYNVKAFDAAGKQLTVEKTDGDVYKIFGHKGYAKVTYTLFANYVDGTYASVDQTGYHLNMPATFMWVKGLDKAPITISFTLPDPSWKIATQLKPTNDPTEFTAPGLQYFMDSPTKIGVLRFREWTAMNTDQKPVTFRLALDADGKEEAVDSFATALKTMVNEAKKTFGEFPHYDYGTYTFIATFRPYAHGDGMEHRNSTMITSSRPFQNVRSLLNTFSHEFFHCWNVERIRPKGIEPFNFEKSNMTDGLWLAEGFTQYYGTEILMRAGLMSEANYLSNLSYFINEKTNTPGAQNYSPIENSQRAVFVDAGVSVDKTNYENMFTSYYSYGAAIALALDLEVKNKFNSSLDKYMQELWKRFGKAEKPYAIADLQHALATITNEPFAKDFFSRYVYGHEPYNYKSALAKTGMQLLAVATGTTIGDVDFTENKNGLTIVGNTVKGTSLYNAGLDDGDILLSADGKELTSVKDLQQVLSSRKPGDSIIVRYKHRNMVNETKLLLQQDDRLRIVGYPSPNK